MNNKTTTYTIASRLPYLVTDHAGKALYLFIKDSPSAESQGQKILERYLGEACDSFKKEIEALKNPKVPFTEAEEKRLMSMLLLIIDAKKTWVEEEVIAQSYEE